MKDLTDQSFHPCQCGYQICLWCYHQMNEQLDAKCPACRTPFVVGGVQPSSIVAPRAVQAAAIATAAQSQRGALAFKSKKSANANKERLSNVPPAPNGKVMEHSDSHCHNSDACYFVAAAHRSCMDVYVCICRI
jgi:hypothetical protein